MFYEKHEFGLMQNREKEQRSNKEKEEAKQLEKF